MKEDNVIERLNKLDLNGDPIDELFEIFDSIEIHKLMPMKLFTDEKIIRLRLNENGRQFKNVADLSYPPSEKVNYQRANVKGVPMFYGSIFSELNEKNTSPRLVVTYEVSSFAKDSVSTGIQRLVYSLWKTKENLHLLALPFDFAYNKPCDALVMMKKQWEEFAQKINMTEQSEAFSDFICSEMANDANDGETNYFIIANYVYYLLYVRPETKHYDGIIYPSVPLKGNGFNVAIKPSVVDNKICFASALESHLIKIGKKSIVYNLNDAHGDEVGDLKYTVNSSYNQEEYDKLIFDLDYIN